MFKYKPAPEHYKYRQLLDDFFEKVERQEETYVEAGLPAEGLAAFIRSWFEAWASQDPRRLRKHLNGEIPYADATTNGRDFIWGKDDDIQFGLTYRFMAPDLVFYPQNDTAAALPYYDFLDDVVRVTIPWRGVFKPRFPSFRTIENVGVDRYVMAKVDGEWKIDRIDTDWDVLNAAGQLLPIPLRYPSQRTLQRMVSAIKAIAPGLIASLDLDQPLPEEPSEVKAPAKRLASVAKSAPARKASPSKQA